MEYVSMKQDKLYTPHKVGNIMLD